MSAAADAVAQRLRELAPQEVHLRDESEKHRHHAEGGSGAHLRLRIVSARFEGLPPLQRHRLVYECVGSLPEMGLHALAICAQTPAEAAAAENQKKGQGGANG